MAGVETFHSSFRFLPLISQTPRYDSDTPLTAKGEKAERRQER